MNNAQTIEKMHRLKLFGMARAFQALLETGARHELTPDELTAHLIDAEWEWRQNNRFNRLIRYARFRYQASMEQLNFHLRRDLDKNRLLRFAECMWIEKKQNIIVTGPTGVGKSFIACALGHQTCMCGFQTVYFNAGRLFTALKAKQADGTYLKELKRIQKQDLLILDDFGLEHLDKTGRLMLLELMEDRHGLKSTIITSQLPVKNWHEIIGDPTIADAICDRLINNAHRIDLKGESVRKKYQESLT